MISFYQKFIRYLKIETHWRVFLLIIIVLAGIIKIENSILKDLSIDIERLRDKEALIQAIPGFRRELAARRKSYLEIMERLRREEEERRLRKKEELRRLREEMRKNNPGSDVLEIDEMHLEGITGVEGDRSALINGKIYNKNQRIGDYIITDILKEKVILRDSVTRKTETLNLFEEEELREQ